jgi:hypothetical protein
MFQGRSLVELAQELERQKETKKDYIAPTKMLEVEPQDKGGVMMKMGDQRLGITNLAHNQIRDFTKIPANYYNLMMDKAPDLLARNVNHWFQENTDPRLVRTLDGRMRAFLSNKYRTIDNFDLAQAVLPVLVDEQKKGDLEFLSQEVTENRLYLKVVTKRLTFEVKKGDVVQVGIVISNSEVGQGAIAVEPLLYRLICTNGAIINDMATRRAHVGRTIAGLDNDLTEFFRDETRQADDKALLMKLQDTVKAAFEQVKFEQIKDTVITSTTRRIEIGIDKALDRVVEKFDIREREVSGILQNIVNGGIGLTQWGLANAVTELANTTDNYERATELEKIGGSIITLPDHVWEELAVKAA